MKHESVHSPGREKVQRGEQKSDPESPERRKAHSPGSESTTAPGPLWEVSPGGDPFKSALRVLKSVTRMDARCRLSETQLQTAHTLFLTHTLSLSIRAA